MGRRAIVLLVVAVALTGCVNTSRFQADPSTAELLGLKPVVSEPGELVEPLLGAKASAAVGAPMASARTGRWRPYFLIEGAPSASWDDKEGFSCTVKPTPGFFRVAHTDVNGEMFLEESRAKVVRSFNGKPFDAQIVLATYRIDRAGTSQLVMRGMDTTDMLMKPLVGARLTKKLEPEQDSTKESRREFKEFRRELIYTGRSGRSISILYREFSDDMARPAFSQQLQYDISQDPVIGYQGARFKILSASNTEVSYEVLSSLSAR